MIQEDITPEMQAEYERHLKESAEKGGKIVSVIATVHIVLTVLNLLSGNYSIAVAIIRVALSCYLLRGSTVSRVIFMLGAGISVIYEAFLTFAVIAVVQDTGLNSAAIVVFIAVALDLILAAVMLYFMYFNKNVDDFFKHSHSWKNRY